MSKTKVVLHNKAFAELRKSPGMMAELSAVGGRVRNAAGDGYETDGATAGKNRAYYTVYASSIEAKLDEARNNTLLRALDAG